MSYLDRNPGQDNSLVSIVLVAVMAVSFAFLVFGAGFETAYAGYGALIAIPFAFGALVTQSSNNFSWLGCLGTPIVLFAISLGLVWFGVEGLVCVAMVMPFWIVAAIGGGLMSVWLKRQEIIEQGDRDSEPPVVLKSIGFAAAPFVIIFAEAASPPNWQAEVVERSVIVESSVDRVWPLLISIPSISTEEGTSTFTHDWLGIPRPTDAMLVSTPHGLVRKAWWGQDVRFEEAITDLEPGQRIGWQFRFPDDSIRQHTDRHISPDGPMLRILNGEYRLQSLSDGTTRVTLATTYQMRTRLGTYFAFWGEILLGDVEHNVLEIIRSRAEYP